MILVTGAAGFIGFHLCLKLLESGTPVLGIDNLNDYYDPSLKSARIKLLEETSAQNATQFVFEKIDLIDVQSLIPLFKEYAISCVVNPRSASWSSIFHRKSIRIYPIQFGWIF